MKCKLLIFNTNLHKLNSNYSGILFLEIRGTLMEIRVQEKNWKIFLENTCGIEKSCTFAPRNKSGNSSVGRARPCQGRGREFESRFPLQGGILGTARAEAKFTLIMPSREQECRLLKAGGNSSVGRARPCQGRGREFESRFPLHKVPSEIGIFCKCLSGGIGRHEGLKIPCPLKACRFEPGLGYA